MTLRLGQHPFAVRRREGVVQSRLVTHVLSIVPAPRELAQVLEAANLGDRRDRHFVARVTFQARLVHHRRCGTRIDLRGWATRLNFQFCEAAANRTLLNDG